MFGRKPPLMAGCLLLLLSVELAPGDLVAASMEQRDLQEADEESTKVQESNQADHLQNRSQESPVAGLSSQGGPAEQVPPYMQHMTIILVCLHLSVFVTGLVGNSLVCLSVFRNKSLQTVTNYYIVNLAVADFLVILICLPPTVYWDLTLTWNFGLILCKLVLYLQSISVSVSVLTLTCISIDRWYAICRPLQFSSTKYRAKITICLIWLLSMLIGSPDAIFLTTKPLYEEDDYVYTDCTYSWPESNTKIYQLCIVTLLFVGPFVLMSISYSHIVNVLWRNEMSAAIQSDEIGSGASAADYGHMGSTLEAPSLSAQAVTSNQHNREPVKRRKRKRRRTDGHTSDRKEMDQPGAVVVVVAGIRSWQKHGQTDLKQARKRQTSGQLTAYEGDESTGRPDRQAGNELAKCLALAGDHSGPPTPGEPLGPHSLAPRDGSPIKKKLIPQNQSCKPDDGKSSCVQLSGITTIANGEKILDDHRDDDDRDDYVEPFGSDLIPVTTSMRGQIGTEQELDQQETGDSIAKITDGKSLKSIDDDRNDDAPKRDTPDCCGLFLAGRRGLWSLGRDNTQRKLGDSSRCSAKLTHLGPGAGSRLASAVASSNNKHLEMTSKRYRRNLANYAAKQGKYPTKTIAKAPAPTSSSMNQLESESLGADLTKHNCQNHRDNLHLPEQQNQQQPPNYLSSSSNNNARFYKLIESRKKAAKMLIVIVIMFGLCYLPIHFLNTLRYTIGLPQNDITTIASLVSHWLCYFNSAINPLIYNLMSGKFRKEFANLFFCRCFRRTN